MTDLSKIRVLIAIPVSIFLSACASSTTLVDPPSVSLTGVELQNMDLRRQTFLLNFDVSNPNPFPLPIKAVKYNLLIDDEKFAGGETEGKFTIPAGGDDDFMISVDLDLLSTATQLSSLFRAGMPGDLSYELEGSLAVDIPLTPPIPFSTTGRVDIEH